MKKKIMVSVILALTLGLVGCGDAAEPIKIATKPMTEQYILGEILSLVLTEGYGIETELTKGIGGGTNNIQPAMEKGEFDLYPEYISSGWVMVLGHDAQEEAVLETMKKEYEERFDMTWAGMYGFNNTYAVAVRGDVARAHNLKTVSDLAAVAPTLVFGGNPDYIERKDGFGALCDTYGLSFKEVKDIDIGLKYTALFGGDVDVINGFTTDAQLGNAENDIVVLEDDLGLQANYFACNVVRQDAMAQEQDLDDALAVMTGLINEQEMSKMNYEVEVMGQDEKEVARAFLVEKGIL